MGWNVFIPNKNHQIYYKFGGGLILQSIQKIIEVFHNFLSTQQNSTQGFERAICDVGSCKHKDGRWKIRDKRVEWD